MNKIINNTKYVVVSTVVLAFLGMGVVSLHSVVNDGSTVGFSAHASGLSSITCEDLGYDMTVAKFEWENNTYVPEFVMDDYHVSISGDASVATWESGGTTGTVIVKAATSFSSFSGGITGTVEKSSIGTGKHDISNLQFCGFLPTHYDKPMCEGITAKPPTIQQGQSSTLSWTVKNAENVTKLTIDQGVGEVTNQSEQVVSPKYDTTYTLSVFGKYGKLEDTCTTDVYVTKPDSDPKPTFPECPLSHKEGRTIVDFTSNDKLRSDRDLSRAQTEVKPVNLAAGEYKVTLVGWDGYKNRTTAVQPNEVWALEFLAGSETVATSDRTTDLENKVLEAIGTDVVNTALSVSQDVDGVRGIHPVYPDSSSPNSLYAVCAALDPIEKEPEPEPISCEANVDFTASPDRIDRGDSSELQWSTTDVHDISIDRGIGEVATSGSSTVSPSSNTTYTLTATDGTTTIDCPITVRVDQPAPPTRGGGGSPSPRCELSVSETRVAAGDRVTLTWSGRNVGDIEITDDSNNVIVTTRDRLFAAKRELFSGTQTVRPEVTTTYTMVAESGSRDDICEVTVRVDEDTEVTVVEDREQPLVSGIALSQVPYTGFEAGPMLTFFFYTALATWALFVAYLYVRRQQQVPQLAVVNGKTEDPKVQQGVRTGLFPQEYKTAVTASVAPAVKMFGNAPSNLPVEPVATPSTESPAAQLVDTQVDEVNDVQSSLERQAHQKRVLVSADVLERFIEKSNEANRNDLFDVLLDMAAASYPAEDGWIVLNLARMEFLLEQS